ncbi:MAG: flippase, partial [Bacteriovorax sp.]|nr:flippase [Bacteriovorax sp.]
KGNFLNLFSRFKQKYFESLEIKKITHNLSWLILDRIFRLLVGVFLGAWFARSLGPANFGVWNYAIAYSSLFGAIAALGLDSIVIRELLRHPLEKNKILGSAFVLKLVAGLLTFLSVFLIVLIFKKDEPLVSKLIIISSLVFIFQAFSVIDFYFQSQVLSKKVVWSQNLSFILMSVLKIYFLITKKGLVLFGIATAAEALLTSGFLIYAYYSNSFSIRDWRFSWELSKNLLKDSWLLTFSSLAVMVYMKIDQIMISNISGATEAGIYSAAVKISELWYFVPVALVSSVYPSIIESKKVSESLYYSRLQKLYNLMAIIGFAVAIVVTLFKSIIINLLYGPSYHASSDILAVHIWAGVSVCLGVASSSWLLVENLQKYSFINTVLGAVFNVLLNLILIPKMGAMGAALATTISYFISVFAVLLFKETRKTGGMLLSALTLNRLKISFR